MSARQLIGLASSVALLAVATASAAPKGGAPGAISYSGTDAATLHPFLLKVPSTLRWTNSGPIFQVFAKSGVVGNVSSAARAGATYMPRGRYVLTVNAIGSWKLSVAAGIEHPRRFANGWMGFSGNGGRQLPPFTTAHAGQLSWTCDGAHFQLLAALGRNGNVDSQAHKGSTRLAAGKHGLTVNAIGRWTVAWKP